MKTKERFSYLREERISGKPASLVKMEKWLTARMVDLGDHVKDMEETAAVDGGQALDEGDLDLEMGGADGLGLSEDEEVFSEENDSSSDSE